MISQIVGDDDGRERGKMMGEVKKRYATLRRIGIEHTRRCESHYIGARRSTCCSTWIRGVGVRISGRRRI